MATMGHPQARSGGTLIEAGIVTSGDDLGNLKRFMPEGGTEYHAADVIRILLSGLESDEAERVTHASAVQV